MARPRTVTLPGTPPSEGNPKFQFRVKRELHERILARGGLRFILEAIHEKLLREQEEAQNGS